MEEKDFLKNVIENKLVDKEKVRNVALKSSRHGGKMTPKRFILSAAAVIIILIGVFALMAAIYIPYSENATNPYAAQSYKKVYSAVSKANTTYNHFDFTSIFLLGGYKSSAPNESIDISSSADSFSSTNIQTEGMDEGDIVKTDGEYIYKLGTTGCYIISAEEGTLSATAKISIDSYLPYELYLNGDRLVMVGGIYDSQKVYGMGNIQPLTDCVAAFNHNSTDIRIYDITDRANPVLERKLVIDGAYQTSRISMENNKLFYMVSYRAKSLDDYLPRLSDSALNDGEYQPIAVENIYIYDDLPSTNYFIVGNVDLAQPEAAGTMYAYLGLEGTIYLSAEYLYVATFDVQSKYEKNVFGWVRTGDAATRTRLVKISLDDLSHKSAVKIDGTVKDRYSLDEYQGYLRIVATVDTGTRYTNVYVLDGDLETTGFITDIAPGEAVYAVKFNKDSGSLVTFRTIDPYFNLDLSDPHSPKISIGLKEDGVSYYIHYIDDRYTVGIGKMSEEIGGGVRWTGLKVSLYDNSSGEAVNIKTVIIEGQCYAELFSNPKALLYSADHKLFGFSYENWTYNSDSYLKQGFAVFRFDLDKPDDEKLSYEQTLTNLNTSVSLGYDHEYYNNYWSFISRGIQIGDYIYTVSDRYIKSYSIDGLMLSDTLVLEVNAPKTA